MGSSLNYLQRSDGQVAIEVKGTNRVERNELRPLMVFRDEYAPCQTLVVCNEPVERNCPTRTIPLFEKEGPGEILDKCDD